MNEFKVKINGNDYNLVVKNVEENIITIEVNGQSYSVELEKPLKTQKPVSQPIVSRTMTSPVSAPTATVTKPAIAAATAAASASSSSASAGGVKSPLPGVILDIAVNVGDSVTVGQKLVILEAMKMENTINSDKEGKVIEIKVQKGDSVLEGADLVIIG